MSIIVCFYCKLYIVAFVCMHLFLSVLCILMCAFTHTLTHTHTRLTALCPGQPGWAGTRKVKPNWILLKQETVSGSGIRWAMCKSAPRSRQITMPVPHRSVFYRPDALPAAQPTASKHCAFNTMLYHMLFCYILLQHVSS